MRITNVYRGADTCMCMVDVLLETPEEAALDEPDVWLALAPLFEAQGINPDDVVDIFMNTNRAR